MSHQKSRDYTETIVQYNLLQKTLLIMNGSE